MYIAAHKVFDVPRIDDYIPIQVGASISEKKLGFIGDNTGDNISYKNRNYCELTALYWIWKNDISDEVGLVHYRRYFSENIFSFGKVIDSKKISKLLMEYDIIVPQRTIMLKKTVRENYAEKHYISDLMICQDIISAICPCYLDAFAKVLMSHQYYAFNMFIMKRQIFELYMNWLFPILDLVESRVNVEEYDSYNQRVFGFLAERLFNVWLQKNLNFRIKELPVYNTENRLAKQRINNIKDRIKNYILI